MKSRCWQVLRLPVQGQHSHSLPIAIPTTTINPIIIMADDIIMVGTIVMDIITITDDVFITVAIIIGDMATIMEEDIVL